MKQDKSRKKAPCPKCPYKLGIVKTLVNPCPQCKLNGYRSFEQFQKHNITSGQAYANIYDAFTVEENTQAFGQIVL